MMSNEASHEPEPEASSRAEHGAGAPRRAAKPGGAGGGVKVRLQRVMADTGIAARRVCEQLIAEGHVTVNGVKVTRLPVFVDPDADEIRVDGRPIPKPERPIYVMVHKPARVMVTTSGEAGDTRPTIVDLIDHPARTRLFPIGRLDYETTGLVLLTNDGELSHKLTHPRYEIPKTYLAMVKGVPDAQVIADLNKKLKKADEREAREKFGRRARIEVVTEFAMRGKSRPRVRLLKTEQKDSGERSLVEIVLFESRHGQIEELLRILGCPVKKLVRVAYGPVVLRTLAPGKWRELTPAEITALRKAASGQGPKAPESVLEEGEEQTQGAAQRSADGAAERPASGRGERSSDGATRPRRARRGARDRRPGGQKETKPWGWQLATRSRNDRGQRERDLRRAGKLPPAVAEGEGPARPKGPDGVDGATGRKPAGRGGGAGGGQADARLARPGRGAGGGRDGQRGGPRPGQREGERSKGTDGRTRRRGGDQDRVR